MLGKTESFRRIKINFCTDRSLFRLPKPEQNAPPLKEATAALMRRLATGVTKRKSTGTSPWRAAAFLAAGWPPLCLRALRIPPKSLTAKAV